MEPNQLEPSAAQVPLEPQAPAAVDPSTPAAPPAGTPPDDEAQKLRDRLAAQGRELATARAQAADNARLTTTVETLQRTVGQLTDRQIADETARREAQLAVLSPAERAIAETNLLKDKVKELEGQVSGRSSAQDAAARAAAYKQTRMPQLIVEANQAFGLTGTDLEIKLTDAALNDTSEEAFIASVRATGLERQAQGTREGATTVANKANAPAAAKTYSESEVASIAAAAATKAVNDALGNLGAGSSLSPKPAGGGAASPATTEDFQKVLGGYDSRKGPAAMRKQLEAIDVG